jgi:hypothetical protein
VLGLLGGGLLVVVVLAVLAVTLIGTTAEPDDGASYVGPVGPGSASSPAGVGPPGLDDHWHAAFGIDVCGEWGPDLADIGPSTTGIHTHDDGIVHVHPFTTRAAGDRARMGHFLDAVGLLTTDDDVVLVLRSLTPDDRTCAGEPAAWSLVRFDPDVHGAEPVAVVEDLADVPEVRFEANRQAYVLAFLPAGELPPPPPSLGYLDRVSPPPG